MLFIHGLRMPRRFSLHLFLRRNHVEIVAGILEAAKRNATITGIMYQAGLNFNQAQRYVNLLVKKGLLKTKTQGKKKFFLVSDRGLEYLRKYNELAALF